jgi:transposase
MLTATVVKTWAPLGQTPTVRHWYRHDRVSVISGLSVSPRRHRVGMYYRVHLGNIKHPEVLIFLLLLMRHLRGHIIILWDNGQIHKGDQIGDFFHKHPRLHLEFFPGYAPELNPDEGVWGQAKNALANGRPRDKEELRDQVQATLANLRQEPAILRACIHNSELPLFQ